MRYMFTLLSLQSRPFGIYATAANSNTPARGNSLTSTHSLQVTCAVCMCITWLLTMSGCGACWNLASSGRRLSPFMPCVPHAVCYCFASLQLFCSWPSCCDTAQPPTWGSASCGAAWGMWLIPTYSTIMQHQCRSAAALEQHMLVKTATAELRLAHVCWVCRRGYYFTPCNAKKP
jgi:hypothetical protein